MLNEKQVDDILKRDITLTELMEKAPFIWVVVDRRGNFVRVNQLLCDIIGYSKREIYRTPFIEFVHPDDKDATIEQYLNGDVFNDIAEPYKGFTNRYKVKGDGWAALEWYSTDVSIEDNKLACAIFKGYE